MIENFIISSYYTEFKAPPYIEETWVYSQRAVLRNLWTAYNLDMQPITKSSSDTDSY